MRKKSKRFNIKDFIFARRTPWTISPRMNAKVSTHFRGLRYLLAHVNLKQIPRAFSPRKFIRKYQDIYYFKSIERNLSGVKSVLDVGCGDDSPIRRVRKTFYSEGIDVFEDSIKKSKKKKIHDKYTVSDIRKVKKIYKNKSFDAVIALDVIEHLNKKESITLIGDMEKIAKNKVILLTPHGFYHQDAYDNNPYQVHKSEWKIKDLEKLGYKVYGLRGLKYLRGEYASIKFKPWFFWGAIAFLSEIPLYFVPSLSYHLFAIKKIS